VPTFDTSLVIRLLDLQVVGPDDWLLGKVDDVLLHADESRLEAVAILVGPGALAHRYPGRIADWWAAVSRRMNWSRTAEMAVVPLTEVTTVGSSVRVTPAAQDVLLDSFGLENWLRAHVVTRIPGAKAPEWPARAGGVPDWATDTEHRLSDLLAMTVRTPTGPRDGVRVVDVHGRSVRDTQERLGPVLLDRVSVGPRVMGSRLGYGTADLTGPAPVRGLVNAFHRDLRTYDWDAVERVSWRERTLTLSAPDD
jgi:hypothetical protein